ncbi:pyridoxamine 5'-phosphate oxidase family protein [Knoellia sp. CPCC 206435]|uniref:pyridoxamine 5'-phosphate oxidase family protein n=1 Tax=Knoellia terrae TaxID=3404797 RepID=UPI003B42EE08
MDDTTEPAPQERDPGAIRETSVQECWELLRQAVIGRLAVVHDGAPDIFPVNFAVDHGTVVIRTAGGTKHDAARSNPVAFEVDGYDVDTGEAWSVVARGKAVGVRDVDDSIAILNLPLVPWAKGPKPHLLRLAPVTLTGRRFAVSGGARRA